MEALSRRKCVNSKHASNSSGYNFFRHMRKQSYSVAKHEEEQNPYTSMLPCVSYKSRNHRPVDLFMASILGNERTSRHYTVYQHSRSIVWPAMGITPSKGIFDKPED